MIGTSRAEYCFIVVCIATLRLVAPLSICFLAACLATGHVLVSPALLFIASCESVFYAIFLARRRHLTKPSPPRVPPRSRAQRQALFAKCAATMTAERFVEWFIPSHEDIRQENVREWLLWALFSSTLEYASPEWDGEIKEYLDLIEQVLGRKLAEGRGPVKSIRLSFDEVELAHRPLVWYMIVALVDTSTSLVLLSLGFKHYAPSRPQHFVFPPRILLWMFSRPGVTPHYSYWFRPGQLSRKHEAFVFLHGIGIGLHPYLPMLREIVKADPSRDILLIEFLPVSMRMTGPMASRQSTVAAMNDILDTLELKQVVLAAHSYGTFLASYIVAESAEDGPADDPCKALNDKVVSLVLIDPIPILLHLPTVTYNFLYRSPRRANEWQLWYFASSDPDVTRMLRRGFFWEEGCLWREDLERFVGEGSSRRRVSVVLGGVDQIIPSAAIREYLSDGSEDWAPNAGPSKRWANSDETLQVFWFPDLDHATVFETKERRKVLIQAFDPKPRSYGTVTN